MRVSELIQQLKLEDGDAEVYLVCDYGDIGHTKQALPIERLESGGRLVDSAYSQSHLEHISAHNLAEDTYCPECDEMYDTGNVIRCPVCSTKTVVESGELAETHCNDAGENIVTLRYGVDG